jgi:hypothetical protein
MEDDDCEMTPYQKRREAEREARLLAEKRLRVALMLYRDMVAMDRHRHVNSDEPEDFLAIAVEAVEAADTFLSVLEPKADAPAVPPYEG